MLGLCELFEERLRRVKFEGKSWLADGHCRCFLIHLFPLQVSLERVEEQPVMRYTVPKEDLLLLLSPYAIVFVHEIQERTLRLLEGSIRARLQIAQVGKDAFLELL